MERTAHALRILKGSIQLEKTLYLPGEVVSVDSETLSFLQGVAESSPTLQFELVDAVSVPAVVSTLEDAGDEQDTQEPDEGDEETPTTGEGVQLEEEAPVDSEPAPVSAPAAPAAGPLGLKSVDAKVAAALHAAGFDSVEALQAATVEDLVKVQGIGKVRAEAILAEVAA